MKKKLTIKYVSSLTPKDKYFDVWDTDLPGFFARVHPTGNTSYYLFYRNNKNEKRTYSIGKGLTAVQARDIAEKSYGKVKNDVDIVTESKAEKQKAAKAKKTTLSAFLNDVYLPWLTENRVSGRNAYNRIKHSFDLHLSKQLEKITKWDMEIWKKERRKNGVSDKTLKKDLAELKSMMRRAKDWDFIAINPLYDYKYGRLEENLRVRYLTGSERKRLYKALDDRQLKHTLDRDSGNQWREQRGYQLFSALNQNTFTDYLKPIVILALNTGMRRGEIFKLKWLNIDFNSNHIKVDSSTAKSKKARYIPLNQEAREALTAWKKQHTKTTGLVFKGKSGEQLNDIRKSWLNVINNSEIDDFRFHDMRHDFASQLVKKGVDLYVVKELLGHSTIQMTERYAHLAPKQLEDAVNLLNA